MVAEKKRNKMKGLFPQQVNNCSEGGLRSPNKNQGNYNNGKGAQKGTGNHNHIRPLKDYSCQQFRHRAWECQNPAVPYSDGQQFPTIPAQGLNVHVQTCAPMQCHAAAPLR